MLVQLKNRRMFSTNQKNNFIDLHAFIKIKRKNVKNHNIKKRKNVKKYNMFCVRFYYLFSAARFILSNGLSTFEIDFLLTCVYRSVVFISL